jgi:hypothetical protein
MGFVLKWWNTIDMNRYLTYFNGTFASLQIEGGECQLDSLSCWHDNDDFTNPALAPVVAREVGRLDNTSARWRHVGAHIPAGLASANEIDTRVDSRDM